MGVLNLSMTHISLVASSSLIPSEDVDITKRYFEDLGMKVTVPSNLLGEDLLCAHNDSVRFSHLKTALTDPAVDIVWLLRGGYGLTRLIPDFLQMKKPTKQKLFIGFSDGTVLHVFFNQIWGWTSLHGPGAIQLSRKKVGDRTIDATLRIVEKGIASYTPPILRSFNKSAREMSSLSGTLIGGNLCLLTCSLGTRWQINPLNKILFLEDVDERGYRIDRMLMHLQQADVFKQIKGIILGDFTRGEELDGTSLIPAVLERFAANIDLPVFHLPGCGHASENFPLPFNTPLIFSVIHE